MRLAKSLILPLAVLLSGTAHAAQLSVEDLSTDLETLAADETGEPEEAAPAPEDAPNSAAEDEAPNTGGEATGVLAKLEALAAEGNAEAAYHLGMAYHLGANGAPEDRQKAFELFKRSAEAGDPLGAYMLGSYYEGEGGGSVEVNPDLALEYKLAAAEAGHALAQHDVARRFYENGDTDKALDYLLLSAKQGYLPSLQALASLYSGEGKIAKDPVKVYAYVALLQASAGGEPSKRLQAWRDKMQAELTEEQLKQAVAIVSGWKVEPSELTQKALTGESAARRLAGLDEVPEAIRADTKEAREGR